MKYKQKQISLFQMNNESTTKGETNKQKTVNKY